jgi:hypothetical protein
MGNQPSNPLLVLQTNQDLVRLDNIPLDQLAELTQGYQTLEEYDRLREVWLSLHRRSLAIVLANFKDVIPKERLIVPLHAVYILLRNELKQPHELAVTAYLKLQLNHQDLLKLRHTVLGKPKV